jgi:aminoglycoside 3-N-acetyltransferase
LDNQDYIPYQQIAGRLEIDRGTLLWLSADLTRLALTAKRKESGFSAEKFIGSFIELIGDAGTVVIPSFNFNLENKDHFSLKKTLPITGALATEAMKTGLFKRTKNPLHSFLVHGRYSSDLIGLDNVSSFGNDSPFAFFHSYQGKMLILGTTIINAFTFVHYIEELNQVKYRKYKDINIFLEDEGEWRKYRLYTKQPGWTMDMTGLEQLLLERGIAKKHIINGIDAFIIDLAEAFPLVQDDIQHNNAGNIARYSLQQYLKDSVKANLGKIGIRTASDKISHDPGIL